MIPTTSLGAISIVASVVNPLTGALLSSNTVATTLVKGTGDHEPNGDLDSASSLGVDRVVAGTLDAGDRRDVFEVAVPADGTIIAAITLPPTLLPGSVTLVVLAASGTELGRFTPTAGSSETSHVVSGGAVVIVLESDGQSIAYELRVSVVQGDLTLLSVVPPNGGPGTTVTLTVRGSSAMRMRQASSSAASAARS